MNDEILLALATTLVAEIKSVLASPKNWATSTASNPISSFSPSETLRRAFVGLDIAGERNPKWSDAVQPGYASKVLPSLE
jgi:hypothetical protein